ncbi:WD40-repeat-containing domain protein [Haematococcus lacustris]
MLHYSEALGWNADSAECCQGPGVRHIVAVGTYQLDEATGLRNGRLILKALSAQRPLCGDVGNGAKSEQAWQLRPLQTLGLPGVFDLKWAQPGEDSRLQQVAACTVCGSGAMALALSWSQSQGTSSMPQHGSSSTAQHGTSSGSRSKDGEAEMDCPASSSKPQTLAVSTSDGQLALLQVTPACLAPLVRWDAHNAEVWSVAHYGNCQPSVLLSGADDCCLKVWDLRCLAGPSLALISRPEDREGRQGAADDAWSQSLDLEPPTCMHTNRKAHAAGVCSIAPHPAHQHIVATGSYDDQLRIWDLRQTARPVVLSQASTTGGVWRLKWHPHDPTRLLAACMYGGFQVFSTVAVPKTGEAAGEGECQGHGSGGMRDWHSPLHVKQTYSGHGSIGYGADWFAEGARDDALAADAAQALHASSEEQHGSVVQVDEAVALHTSCRPVACAHAHAAGQATAGSQDLVVTASFYDQLLHLWSPES